MNRLTEKDGQGNWRVKGIRWEQLHEGRVITGELREKLYGAVRKSFEESKEKQKSGDSKEQTEPSAGRDGWQEARDTPFR